MKTAENSLIEDKSSSQQREAESSLQFLTFNVAGEEYGIELMSVREIKGWSQTTRLPNSPEFMKGVINLRGVVIPIFDLKSRFGMGNIEPGQMNVVIIIAVGDRLIGILVDSVSDILNTNFSEIRPAPHIDSTIDKDIVSGLISIEEKMVVLLDIEKIFGLDTII